MATIMKLGLHIHPPSKVKQHTLAVYIKEQKMPQKSPQEPYSLEGGGIRSANAPIYLNLPYLF